MVWYGKVWNDAIGDWGHELDDAPPLTGKAKERAELESYLSTHPAYGPRKPWSHEIICGHEVGCEFVEQAHRWLANSAGMRCELCGFTVQFLHTMLGMVCVGTGRKVLGLGKARTDLKPGHVDGYGS